MKTSQFVGIIFGSLIIMLLWASCHRVSPTEVGFKINNSGDYRGVDSLPVVTGYNFVWPGFQKLITLPTTQNHVVWSEEAREGSDAGQQITVSCMGGAGFKIDVGFNYRVDPFLASKIYLKYRTDDLESITKTYLRNIVRGAMQDLAGTMTVDSVLNHLPQFEHAVATALVNRLKPEGFLVDNFNITKKPVATDPNLEIAIAKKIQAKQDAETAVTELQKSVAEANKMIATARGDSSVKVINATADAQVIRVKQAALSSSPQYIELIRAEKWDGKYPTYYGSGTPLINLK